MNLSDPRYFAFLAAVVVFFYALTPGQPRRILLLLASTFFYFALSQFYILTLLFVTLTAFGGARLLLAPSEPLRRFYLFGLVLLVVAAPLLVFKYLGALIGLPQRESLFLWALPVGISFFTFAALGYLIDVYLEVIPPEKSPSRIALFLAFFPIVSAGPIERAGRFIPQLGLDTRFEAENALLGLRLIFIGLLMKVVCADQLAVPIDAVYRDPKACSALEQLAAVLYYPFCLYADFAGYSLIAIGSARLFGLRVSPNFQQPFFSTTIPEFWRSWHISLSSWVRDYLFSPLRMQGRNWGQGGTVIALLVSFIILGLWHGAKWGFFLFGLLHAIYSIASMLTLPERNRWAARFHVPVPVVSFHRMMATFLLAALAFVVFRAETVEAALSIYRAIFSVAPFQDFSAALLAVGRHANLASLALLRQFFEISWIIPALLLGDLLARRKIPFESFPWPLQVIGYNWGLLMILSQWLTHYGAQPFVYYKF